MKKEERRWSNFKIIIKSGMKIKSSQTNREELRAVGEVNDNK